MLYSMRIQVRLERPADAAAIERLTQLVSASPLRSLAVIAAEAGRIVAAATLDGETELVDPSFDRPDVVRLVRLRAKQLAERRAA